MVLGKLGRDGGGPRRVASWAPPGLPGGFEEDDPKMAAESQPKARRGALPGLPCLILFSVVALLVYRAALTGAFLWDDTDWILGEPALASFSGLKEIWFEPGATIQYYPLTYTSWWIDRQLFGEVPFPYHLENVLLHALTASILYSILLRLSIPGALLGALAFLLHPVQAESVAWLTERKNVLSGAFFAASALAWFRYSDSIEESAEGGLDGQRARPGGLAWSLGLFVLALFAKTMTLVLPAMLLVVELGRGRLDRRSTIALSSFLPFSIAAAAITIHLERGLGAVGADFALSVGERIALVGQNVLGYASTLLTPWDLAFVYPRAALSGPTAWVPTVVLGLLTASFLARRGTRRVGLGLVLYVVALAPVLGLVDFYWMRYAWRGDHFQYLATLVALPGLVALGSMGMRRALGSTFEAPWVLGLAAAIPLGLGALTLRQAGQWRDMETLWTRTLEQNPDAWLAHTNLGNLLDERDGLGTGIEHHQRAIEIEPRAFESLNAVGNHLVRSGEWSLAEEHFQRAFEVRPAAPLTFFNLGALWFARGQLDRALETFERGLIQNPDHAGLAMQAAAILGGSKDPELQDVPRAIALAEGALQDPAQHTALNLYTLTKAYLLEGRFEEAQRVGLEGLRLADLERNVEIGDRLADLMNRLREAR